MDKTPLEERLERFRNLALISHPGLWPAWPFLPLVRRSRGAEELGLLYDAFHHAGLTGLSATVLHCNFFEIPDEDWMRFFEVNVLSGIRLSRHYVRGMRARNWGRIVFVSSESGLQIPTEMIHYGVTKTAQLAVARGLAETLAGTNVTVNSVLPGPTSSEGVSTFVADLGASQGKSTTEIEQEFFRSARPSSVIQRFATPAEVAAMIVYVCSAAASATTGAALRVDGGVVRAIV